MKKFLKAVSILVGVTFFIGSLVTFTYGIYFAYINSPATTTFGSIAYAASFGIIIGCFISFIPLLVGYIMIFFIPALIEEG